MWPTFPLVPGESEPTLVVEGNQLSTGINDGTLTVPNGAIPGDYMLVMMGCPYGSHTSERQYQADVSKWWSIQSVDTGFYSWGEYGLSSSVCIITKLTQDDIDFGISIANTNGTFGPGSAGWWYEAWKFVIRGLNPICPIGDYHLSDRDYECVGQNSGDGGTITGNVVPGANTLDTKAYWHGTMPYLDGSLKGKYFCLYNTRDYDTNPTDAWYGQTPQQVFEKVYSGFEAFSLTNHALSNFSAVTYAGGHSNRTTGTISQGISTVFGLGTYKDKTQPNLLGSKVYVNEWVKENVTVTYGPLSYPSYEYDVDQIIGVPADPPADTRKSISTTVSLEGGETYTFSMFGSALNDFGSYSGKYLNFGIQMPGYPQEHFVFMGEGAYSATTGPYRWSVQNNDGGEIIAANQAVYGQSGAGGNPRMYSVTFVAPSTGTYTLRIGFSYGYPSDDGIAPVWHHTGAGQINIRHLQLSKGSNTTDLRLGSALDNSQFSQRTTVNGMPSFYANNTYHQPTDATGLLIVDRYPSMVQGILVPRGGKPARARPMPISSTGISVIDNDDQTIRLSNNIYTQAHNIVGNPVAPPPNQGGASKLYWELNIVGLTDPTLDQISCGVYAGHPTWGQNSFLPYAAGMHVMTYGTDLSAIGDNTHVFCIEGRPLSYAGTDGDGWTDNGYYCTNDVTTRNGVTNPFASGNVIGIAWDYDTLKCHFYKNGVYLFSSAQDDFMNRANQGRSITALLRINSTYLYTLKMNLTGPFLYKPVGYSAIDQFNEVT